MDMEDWRGQGLPGVVEYESSDLLTIVEEKLTFDAFNGAKLQHGPFQENKLQLSLL